MTRFAFSVPSLLLMLVLAAAAQAQQTTPAKPAPATRTSQTAAGIEQDLRVFSGWVNDKLNQAETGVRREMPKVSAEFERQSQRIDRGVDSLSAQGKREYADQKQRYKTWASRQDSLDARARRPETAQQAQDRLLNEKVVLSRARATEMPDLYGRFIEATRSQRRQWTPTDWSNAGAVLANLNTRYEQVREQIPLEDRIRIRSWQGEFRTLEAARDVKDIMDK